MIEENHKKEKIDNEKTDGKKWSEKINKKNTVGNNLSGNLKIGEIKKIIEKQEISKNDETKENLRTNQLLNDKNIKINIINSKTKKSKKRKLTIDEYEKKIKENIFITKICFIISISINFIDILIIIIFPSIFLDIFNIICLILITISFIIILINYILKRIIITSSYYNKTKKILIYISIIIGIYFCNILYIMIHKIMLNSVKNFDIYQIFLGIILIFCYSIINISGNSSIQNDIFSIQPKEKSYVVKSFNNSFSINPQLKENNKNNKI